MKGHIACNERQAFFTSEDTKQYGLWSCQNVCEALIDLLDNIYIRFGAGLCGRIVGVPMDAGCAPLVAGLFLFCCEGDFMASLSDVQQAEIIEAFGSASRYLDAFWVLAVLALGAWSVVFVRLGCGWAGLVPLIPKPHFWICICLFQMDLFRLIYMISAMTLILIW